MFFVLFLNLEGIFELRTNNWLKILKALKFSGGGVVFCFVFFFCFFVFFFFGGGEGIGKG